MWWYDGHGAGWGGWVLMTLAMLALWGILAAAVVALVRIWRSDTSARRSTEAPRERPDALAVLDERFARGEIDADDYTRRRDLLRGR